MDVQPVRQDKNKSKIRLMEDLIPLLEQAFNKSLTRWECETILRNLIGFVSETPIIFVKNLFEKDQLSGINPKLYAWSSKHGPVDVINNRDWQWVLSSHASPSSDSVELPPGESLQGRAWIKSRSVQLGRLMSASSIPGSIPDVRLIIGFWLKKLYEAVNPEIPLPEIPECLTTAYHGFIEWKGGQWKSKKIPKTAFKTVYSCKLTGRATFGVKISKSRVIPDKLWNYQKDLAWRKIREEHVTEFCRGVGTKRLLLYLQHGFEGTLEEFVVRISKPSFFEETDEQKKVEIVKTLKTKSPERIPRLSEVKLSPVKRRKVDHHEKKVDQQDIVWFFNKIQREYAVPRYRVVVEG